MMVLPKIAELGNIPRIEIAGYMEPADEIGGDYYDVLQDGGRLKVGIGDVTGHGLESGVLMLMVQSVARALQEKGGDDPKEFLEGSEPRHLQEHRADRYRQAPVSRFPRLRGPADHPVGTA